ncbi:G8 domain-containing protein [Aliiroseovarius sp. YM-037]|uniref:G8 domain-containing protein n=1 Tax=Aliiroseovarius sp. YM-037 TaxID=3341728 RepID=UPI003A80AFCF
MILRTIPPISRAVIYLVGLSIVALAVYALIALTTAANRPQLIYTGPVHDARPSTYGVGLAGLADWSTQNPFIDVMKSGRTWIGHTKDQSPAWTHADLADGRYLDRNGWVKQIPEELSAIETLILTEQPEQGVSLSGRYLLRYDGTGALTVGHKAEDIIAAEGEVSFTYRPTGQSSVSIRIEETDPNDPIRNISVVHERDIDRHAEGQIFNPLWLARIGDMRALRFMDWMQTNNSGVVKWNERPLPSDYTYTLRGAPVEVMVALANELRADPWFTLPHLASEDYVRNFAGYVKANLDPPLRTYAEFSNEVWNQGFGQGAWAQQNGATLLGADVYDAHAQFAGVQAARMADIWADVYGADAEQRLVRVIATQTGWAGLENAILEADGLIEADDTVTHPPYESFDAYAITGYFSGRLGTAEKADTVRAWIATSWQMAEDDAEAIGLLDSARQTYVEEHKYDHAISLAHDEIWDGSLTGDTQDTLYTYLNYLLPYHADVAARHDLDLIMYEGGTHVVGIGEVREDAVLNDFFAELNYSTEMGALYDALLRGWAESSGTLFTAYVDVGRPSKWGSWGALRHLDDETPRWSAILAAGQAAMVHRMGMFKQGGITPPSTPAEIEAFVAAVRAQTDSHSHGDNAGMAQEHMQVLDLVPHAEVTHIAINNGDWFDPGTWYQGQIPGEGAQAIIPEGLSVTYDGESDASLFTLRVDGELSFATQTDTRMVIDTMVVSPTGRLEIGTEDNPIADGVNADIVIANNGNINTNWDPQLFSRGVISHGDVEIHGAEKTAFLKVDDAPMAGDTSITLAEVPEGWQVGDTLVLSGTHKQGWVWDNDERRVIHRESEDEEVVITGINGSTLTIDRPLEYDHDTPRADLSAYVANMSRNITFSSEDGEGTPLHHRGHVMFMHSDDVDVRYAAFDDLGRTDKSEPAFDVGDLGHVASDSNIKSRYPFHLHKTGTEAQEDPAIAIGNTVSGSPGWGFVHHQSHATFTDNVAFDVFGAAFAAEDGNETGIWSHNMAIRSEGIGWGDFMAKDAGDVARHDNGRTGDGFFFAGRLVEASDNVAVNTTHGFVWMHRSAPIPPLSHTMHQPEIAYGADTIPVDHAIIQGFHDNEAFGTQIGLMVIKGSAEQWHDVRSVFDGFLNWETSYGVDISYTSHYTLIDFDLIATTSEIPFMDAAIGFNLATNTFDFVLNDVTAHGFETGVDLQQTFTFEVEHEDVAHVLIDVETSNVQNAYVGLNPSRHAVLSSDQLAEGRLEFEMTGNTTIAVGETLYLNGTKTDSIGPRNRQFSGDTQRLEFHERIAPLIVNEGYYKTEDGRNVILVEDFIADRATGALHKFAHVVTLNMTDDEIENSWSVDHWGGALFNGTIAFDDVAPETQDDAAATQPRQDVLIDVLANDSHAAGAPLRVDGLSTTPNGNVHIQADGRLLYRPNPDFVGTDRFHYWAADDDGQFTRATVTVEVSENQI